MQNLDLLIKEFTGVDPAVGTRALHGLIAEGERGEEALFAAPIAYPGVLQCRRRWLRYVASREDSVSARLLDRLSQPRRFNDNYATAYLCAGLRSPGTFRNELYKQLDRGFAYDIYDEFISRYEAWGYAGGDASTLLDQVRDDHFKWEKLRTFVFRAGCASCARVNTGDLSALETLVTRRHEKYAGLVEITSRPDEPMSNDVVDDSEMAMRAIQTFSSWRRGAVADEVLGRWSSHPHWRARSFGAMILAALGFQRTVAPVLEWLRREPVQSIRMILLHTLERSGTAAGADALVVHFADRGEGESYLAKAAWRSHEESAALKALQTIAAGTGTAAAEALVSLARLGYGRDLANAALQSRENYPRLNAALALAYLGEHTAEKQLFAMRREAATPIERVYLAAAAAILGKPDGVLDLHCDLVAAAGDSDVFKRVDLFFLHRFLQEAVIDALAADATQAEYLEAWRAELEPLEPLASPVEVPTNAAAPASARLENITTMPSRTPPVVGAASPSAVEIGAAPLKVFLSYSHKDEAMRKNLGAHLAPMVKEHAIAIWHDREIEAGADWEKEINREIDEADLILLLISSKFLESPYCGKELQRALDQRKANKASIVPVVLRPCDWQRVFNTTDYKTQALPRDNRSVAGGSWPNHDAAYAHIAMELRTVVERLRKSR